MNNSQLKLTQFAITVYDEAIQHEMGICIVLGPAHFRIGFGLPDGSEHIASIPYDDITLSSNDPLLMAKIVVRTVYEGCKG